MTSMAAESVATIVCTSKQTRFDITAPNYREVRSPGPFGPRHYIPTYTKAYILRPPSSTSRA